MRFGCSLPFTGYTKDRTRFGIVEAGAWLAVSPRYNFSLIDVERLWLNSLSLSAILPEWWIVMLEGPFAYSGLFACNWQSTRAINHSLIFSCIQSIQLPLTFPHPASFVTHLVWVSTHDSVSGMGIAGIGLEETSALFGLA